VWPLRTAATLDQAALEMHRHAADLVVVNMGLEDNHGLELLARLRRNFPSAEAVAMSRRESSEMCVQALRGPGAADLLVGPVNVEAVRECLARAAERRAQRGRLVSRNVRLRSVCKQLNRARHEISQQVNLLCHDLVKGLSGTGPATQPDADRRRILRLPGQRGGDRVADAPDHGMACSNASGR